MTTFELIGVVWPPAATGRSPATRNKTYTRRRIAQSLYHMENIFHRKLHLMARTAHLRQTIPRPGEAQYAILNQPILVENDRIIGQQLKRDRRHQGWTNGRTDRPSI